MYPARVAPSDRCSRRPTCRRVVVEELTWGEAGEASCMLASVAETVCRERRARTRRKERAPTDGARCAFYGVA